MKLEVNRSQIIDDNIVKPNISFVSQVMNSTSEKSEQYTVLKKFSVEELILLTKKIKLINNKHEATEFASVLEQSCTKMNSVRAKLLPRIILSRYTTADINYKLWIVVILLIHFTIFFVDNYLFHLVNIIGFLAQSLFKSVLFCTAISYAHIESLKGISSKSLPIYSILVPLYREEEKVLSIIRSINNLNYPKNKIEVKIIVEVDDNITLNKLEELRKNKKLPNFIEIIKVGIDNLRTKPKALNYALPYCAGEYVVIYDAEDIPERNQLLKAVTKFRKLGKEYVCLQAKLNFFNANENMLTKFMSIEYGVWFNYLLKGLEIFKLPIPLGGTSNHFKKNILEEIGMWDPYNVAEDAELGLRLYNFGYKTAILDSHTLEEAPINLGNWLSQRARWIKGYVQTILVFIFNKKDNFKLSAVLSTILLIGISSYSFFAFPWILIKIIFSNSDLVVYIWLVNSLLGIVYFYTTNSWLLTNSSFINPHVNNKTMAKKLLTLSGITMFPCYFILHTIASYRAVLELLIQPFKWNKTTHGVSKIDPHRL